MITKIISGGQTGADQGGLSAGKALNIETGGTAPKYWMTEDGPMEEILKSYGLIECKKVGYPARTKENVINSDGTVIFGKIEGSKGCAFTKRLCIFACKPCINVVYPREGLNLDLAKNFFIEWIKGFNIKILNVAGNRESTNPGIDNFVVGFLTEALVEFSKIEEQPKC